jgi:hypothetical protein
LFWVAFVEGALESFLSASAYVTFRLLKVRAKNSSAVKSTLILGRESYVPKDQR